MRKRILRHPFPHPDPALPFQPGQRVRASIEKISLGGDGIARLDSGKPSSGFVVFVPFTAPGDSVEIEVTDRRKNFARGALRQIRNPSPQRVAPPCPYYFWEADAPFCGGCNFQHLNPGAQSEAKTAAIRECLAKIADVPAQTVEPAIAPPEEGCWRYRNKIQIPFARVGGKIAAGFFTPGSHAVAPLDDCLIHPEPMMAIVRFVRERMVEWGLDPYSEERHSGWLRHLVVRRARSDGKMLVTFVTLTDSFPRREDWLAGLRRGFPDVVGILQNVNSERTNVILGELWKAHWGQDFLIERLERPDLELKVSAPSFFQVNTEMSAALYRAARDLLISQAGSGFGSLFDLYCGVGGIALAVRDLAPRIVGADETRSSIEDARENARRLGATHCRFVCTDVRDFLAEVARTESPAENAACVLDPPRAGCSFEVLRSLARLRPRVTVYVSCDPGTLARDLRYLKERGFRVLRVQPVDLFPQSSHIESATLLVSGR